MCPKCHKESKLLRFASSIFSKDLITKPLPASQLLIPTVQTGSGGLCHVYVFSHRTNQHILQLIQSLLREISFFLPSFFPLDGVLILPQC